MRNKSKERRHSPSFFSYFIVMKLEQLCHSVVNEKLDIVVRLSTSQTTDSQKKKNSTQIQTFQGYEDPNSFKKETRSSSILFFFLFFLKYTSARMEKLFD